MRKTPLLTLSIHDALLAAAKAGYASIACSLDLGRSKVNVSVSASDRLTMGQPEACCRGPIR